MYDGSMPFPIWRSIVPPPLIAIVSLTAVSHSYNPYSLLLLPVNHSLLSCLLNKWGLTMIRLGKKWGYIRSLRPWSCFFLRSTFDLSWLDSADAAPSSLFLVTSIDKLPSIKSLWCFVIICASSFFFFTLSRPPVVLPHPLPICFSDYDVDDSNVFLFSSLDLTTVSQLSVIILSIVICFIGGEWGGGGFQGKCARSFFQKSIIKDRKRKKK